MDLQPLASFGSWTGGGGAGAASENEAGGGPGPASGGAPESSARGSSGEGSSSQGASRAAAKGSVADLYPRGLAMVFAWGAGEDGQLGLGNEGRDEQNLQLIPSLVDKHVSTIVAGSRNSLAITASGQVYMWGWNQRSTLGHPFEEKSQPKENQPCLVRALKSETVVQAAVGGWHVLAVTNKGTAFAWGGNEYGQCAFRVDKSLGVKNNARDIRLPISCVSHLRVRQVAAGGMHSLVLTEQGEVWQWGQPWPPANNKEGWVPTRVPGLRNVEAVVAGSFHNVAMLPEGRGVFTWGDNEYGQLGTGTTQPSSVPQAVPLLEGLDVVDIAAGGWHTMAVTASGELWAWGRGEHGRLGLGEDKASKMMPVQVLPLVDETIVQVACGGTHSVALTQDGRMFAFGRREFGRLGPLSPVGVVSTGHPTRVPLPGDPSCQPGDIEEPLEEVSFPLRAAKVSCGGRHTLALVCHADELDYHRKGLRWCSAWARARTDAREAAQKAAREAAQERLDGLVLDSDT